MSWRRGVSVAGALVLLGVAWAVQAAPIVYPSKGQSPQQQQKDDGECYAWAKSTTGIDPAAVASQPASTGGSSYGGGERASGAVRGALGGAAIGAIAGDTGKGAAIGAVAGTMSGGHRARQNQAARAQSSEQYKRDQINTFNRAHAACMEGRGYTVK